MRYTILWSVLYKYDLNTSPSPQVPLLSSKQAQEKTNKLIEHENIDWRFEESSKELDDFSANPIHHPEQLAFQRKSVMHGAPSWHQGIRNVPT